MKRTLIPALVLAAMSSAAFAQSMEERLDAKLKKDFVSAVAWEQDYDAARQKAQDSGKMIFAYFTRSYAP